MIRAFFISLLLIGCSPGIDYSHIKVLEVIDGDTVRLENGKLLRYIGIDTPEIRIKKETKFEFRPQPFSLEAKELNKKLVENKFVRVEFDIERFDNYGRILGYCFVDDIFVNAKLIEEGFAVLYTRPPNVRYVDLFVELQNKARKQKKGLWQAYDVISSDEAHKFIDQIRSVRGKVLSSFKSEKCVFLNFGTDYKTDFTVVIFNDCIKFFRAKDIEPHLFYKDKTIEVFGRIKEYNGPEIIVSMPYQIIVIDEN